MELDLHSDLIYTNNLDTDKFARQVKTEPLFETFLLWLNTIEP